VQQPPKLHLHPTYTQSEHIREIQRNSHRSYTLTSTSTSTSTYTQSEHIREIQRNSQLSYTLTSTSTSTSTYTQSEHIREIQRNSQLSRDGQRGIPEDLRSRQPQP